MSDSRKYDLLVERWLRFASRRGSTEDDYTQGYNAALRHCSDDLERRLDADECGDSDSDTAADSPDRANATDTEADGDLDGCDHEWATDQHRKPGTPEEYLIETCTKCLTGRITMVGDGFDK